jgi:hypothetical protein
MKMVSLIVALAGIFVLALAVLSVFFPNNVRVLGLQSGGLLRGTISLFLLAITIMVYDKAYPRKAAPPKRKRK